MNSGEQYLCDFCNNSDNLASHVVMYDQYDQLDFEGYLCFECITDFYESYKFHCTCSYCQTVSFSDTRRIAQCPSCFMPNEDYDDIEYDYGYYDETDEYDDYELKEVEIKPGSLEDVFNMKIDNFTIL